MTQLYNVPRSTAWSDPDHPPAPIVPQEQLVQAYHGSMSREAREEMEQKLKAGELRALVSTSALELGIDIGTVDLVIQLQSPHGIARGLQRVGRSGHLVSATSKGRIYASHREDLVESMVVAKAMAAARGGDHDDPRELPRCARATDHCNGGRGTLAGGPALQRRPPLRLLSHPDPRTVHPRPGYARRALRA